MHCVHRGVSGAERYDRNGAPLPAADCERPALLFFGSVGLVRVTVAEASQGFFHRHVEPFDSEQTAMAQPYGVPRVTSVFLPDVEVSLFPAVRMRPAPFRK